MSARAQILTTVAVLAVSYAVLVVAALYSLQGMP